MGRGPGMNRWAMTSAAVPPWGAAGTMSTTGVVLGLVASSLFVVLAASSLLA